MVRAQDALGGGQEGEMFYRLLLVFLIALGIGAARAQAAEAPSGESSAGSQDPINVLVKAELAKNFSGARIELLGSVRWLSGAPQPRASEVSNLTENGRGEATFTALGIDGVSQASVSFSAWVPAWVASRRTMPNERIVADSFTRQQMNVASGMAHELRGVILPSDSSLANLQSRQTIMEGQALLSSAVERIPDVRKGDPIRILMSSGDLQLSTQGVAEEPGYVNSPLRVMTGKSKRELTGMLESDGVVEVKL